MILCHVNPHRRKSSASVAKMGTVIETTRFTEKHAKHYIHLYRTKGGPEAKKWATEFLAPGPRDAMVDRVNQILEKNKKGKN